MSPLPQLPQTTAQQISLSRVMAFLVILSILLFLIVWAKAILVPIVFAVLFALTLKPVCHAIERYVRAPWLAIVLTFLAVAIPVAGLVMMFTFQTVSVIDDIPTITEEFQESINRVFASASAYLDLDIEVSGAEWMQRRIGDALDEPFVYVSTLLAGGAGVVGTLLLTFLYTFFLLLYRKPIYHFLLGQFAAGPRERMRLVISDTQRMSYTYLKGLGTVIIILGLLNSIGLTLIGLDFGFFWGFLAAFLAIIPYVGTFIGGLLPFLYALSTTDTLWQPVAVVAMFTVVQAIEGNVITPKVVGASIRMNPLAAIIALFFGGFVWGVEGLILALPLTAVLRILLIHSEQFRPFGLLLSDDLVERDEEFLGSLDSPQFRLANFFRPIARGVYDASSTHVTHTERRLDGGTTVVDERIEVDVHREPAREATTRTVVE